MRKIDATGQKLGKLTLVERIASFKRPTKYRCKCDCGSEVIVLWSNLQSGITQSCGCLRITIVREIKLKPAEKVLAKQVSSYYRKNAKERDIPWSLSLDIVEILILSPCYYCGVLGGNETILGGTKRRVLNNGIDRRDNSLGYTAENSVPCCKDCNFAKGNKTEQQFAEWLKRLVDNGYLLQF